MTIIHRISKCIVVLVVLLIAGCESVSSQTSLTQLPDQPWKVWGDIYDMCGEIENPNSIAACSVPVMSAVADLKQWRQCSVPTSDINLETCTIRDIRGSQNELDIEYCMTQETPSLDERCPFGIEMQVEFRKRAEQCRASILSGQELNCTQEDLEWITQQIDEFKCRMNSNDPACSVAIIKSIEAADEESLCYFALRMSKKNNCTAEMLHGYYQYNYDAPARFESRELMLPNSLKLRHPEKSQIIRNCYGTKIHYLLTDGAKNYPHAEFECLFIHDDQGKKVITQIRDSLKNKGFENLKPFNAQSPGWEYEKGCETATIIPSSIEAEWDLRINDMENIGFFELIIFYSIKEACT